MSNTVADDLPEDRPETLNDATLRDATSNTEPLNAQTPADAAIPFVHERKGPDDSYGADQIQILEGLEAVRKRPGMYIGSTGPRGLHHLVYEVVDNSVDEALAGYCDDIKVFIRKDGSVRVVDNGRGIPVAMNQQEQKSTVEVVLTILHAGGKFGGGAYAVSGGLHGVGISVVNALSRELDVEVRQQGYVWRVDRKSTRLNSSHANISYAVFCL